MSTVFEDLLGYFPTGTLMELGMYPRVSTSLGEGPVCNNGEVASVPQFNTDRSASPISRLWEGLWLS